jgi:hypothetical protein
MHLDLWIDDLTAANERAIALGARLVKLADDPAAAQGFQVYADPAGHPFCLCWDWRSPHPGSRQGEARQRGAPR